MSIKVAKTAGYCFGVRRAVEIALKAAEAGPVYCVGPLIHNSAVISMLEQKGARTCASASDVPCGATAIVRAHGLRLEDLRLLEQKGCRVIDATCPDVGKIHNIVAAESEKSRKIAIIGKADHPEVEGIFSRCTNAHVLENAEDARIFALANENSPVSVVLQTTLSHELAEMLINYLKRSCKSIEIFDTICLATQRRQNEAAAEAERSDAVIVVGDRKSSNSLSLYSICASRCAVTQFVGGACELDLEKLRGVENVFITAGASTPDLIIEEVHRIMTDEIKTEDNLAAQDAAADNTAPAGESFEDMLEQSLKNTLHMGDKVTGTVTRISATEVSVDLGAKHAGFIPIAEVSDDPTFNVAESLKVGDEIESVVIHINDVEGLIRLSKKRLDSKKNWELVENAVESKEALDGIIVEQNKGGVVALIKGVRVFIPASQTGLPRDASFDTLIKTTRKVRITEVNPQRRRVVGSIKAAYADTRREAQEKIWSTIAVGSKYKGIVKSFTTYGAFVDIGGVDGMIHVSELSWNRVKHPSEVLAIGQEIDVFVIELDHEKKKISLGYRKPEDNPWLKFESQFKVGDVASVTVVKLMPFGAFAEVIPGVDGLIHISQIDPDRRIGKPDEVLTIGQRVDAKIVEIDHEKKKISLSIRALLDPLYEIPGESETED